MNRYFMKSLYCITIIGFLILSCNRTKQYVPAELFEIPVDIDQNYSLPLSEIAEDITAIELEMTNESLINPDYINQIIFSDNYIIVSEVTKTLVFNKDGKFHRRIGSMGQGPGEYSGLILGVALDEKKERIFITAFPGKIICFDIDGKLLKEVRTVLVSSYRSIDYINDELLIVNNQMSLVDKIVTNTTSLHRLTEEFQVIDSLIFRKNHMHMYTSDPVVLSSTYYNDFIFKGNRSVYFFYCEIYSQKSPPVERVLRDTLYRFEDNQLVPELKLKFKNDGIDGSGNKYIDLWNIFRSSRYVFSIYSKNNDRTIKYHFCYDTKTGKSYNMLDGYSDDINEIEKRVSIRPLVADSEIFYYWHTNMKPGDLLEPNPTLYIIKLKK